MLEQLKRLLEQKPEGSGWNLKAKPLIKMEYCVWREKEQKWESPQPVESVEVIIS